MADEAAAAAEVGKAIASMGGDGAQEPEAVSR
jgi:hypothetical protein